MPLSFNGTQPNGYALAAPFVSLREKAFLAFFPVTQGFIEPKAAMRVNEILAAMARCPCVILGKLHSDIRQIPIL
jgi:hypothetical protein